MHLPTIFGLFALLLPHVSALRFAMYIDEWHTTDLPGKEHTAGITHAIMAFAKSTLFNSDSPAEFKPFEPVDKMRARFEPDTKLMIAIGGWGDTEGFSIGAKDEASRARYAKNVAKMVDDGGFDGVGMFFFFFSLFALLVLNKIVCACCCALDRENNPNN